MDEERINWQEIYDRHESAGRIYALNWAVANTMGLKRALARILLRSHLVLQGQKALNQGRLLEALDYFCFAQAQTPSSIALKWKLHRLRQRIKMRLACVMLLWVGLVTVGYIMLIEGVL